MDVLPLAEKTTIHDDGTARRNVRWNREFIFDVIHPSGCSEIQSIKTKENEEPHQPGRRKKQLRIEKRSDVAHIADSPVVRFRITNNNP